jgi:hypothetical protein
MFKLAFYIALAGLTVFALVDLLARWQDWKDREKMPLPKKRYWKK